MSSVHKNDVATMLGDVFREYGFEELAIIPSDSQMPEYQLIATIGLTGQQHGFINLCTDINSAESLMRTILNNMGMDDDGEDEGMMPGIITELANQTGGRYVMLLEKDALNCDITPPTLISGKTVAAESVGYQTMYGFEIGGRFGKLYFSVSLKN